ncbi:hypothetical protein CI109_100519 [Kwoniella shandongensis]|uniref:WD40 repeat-containing protein SMU1 n=1 Tax=Kwoniella shandongensis TaxID=1734106 RepID=A0A5M6BQC2_9TREE|nr:uncharacterized protein CI109_007359 [Kwoniella shandongensis]KAA5524312.1 hypothetical protein CI109_007359 [Kwoniella shandongensis]
MSLSTSELAGPSRAANAMPEERALTPRQREKAPATKVELEDVQLDESAFDQEIDLLISQYLESRGVPSAVKVWDEEVLGRGRDRNERQEQLEDVERAILDGDYSSIEGLISKPGLLRPQTQKAFLYLCYRQMFLEHVENRESQKAFNLLQKRLKPLEHYQPVPYDFYSLSYLTSASTVHDAPTFRDWAGVGPERDRLVSVWRELMDSEKNGHGRETRYVPPDRLKTLLRQAAAWQVGQVGRVGDGAVKVSSLLHDYRPLRLPERLLSLVAGHTANVKCVDLIGPTGHLGVSGASDCTLRIFSTDDGSVKHILKGHNSRIWGCASSSSGHNVASASGDSTVRLWSVANGDCRGILQADGGDVYDVKWRPGHEDQMVTASYDRIIRSWDVETGKQVRTFSGHSQSTLAVAFDTSGNTIASGSKDKHIRLWDAVGGVCIQNLTGCLGEITSVEFDEEGKYLLAGCKDNSNRLWDLRMQRNIYRYTGHQNTSKNLIRCGFAQSSSLIIGGSEDGSVYIWEREGGSASTSGQGQAASQTRSTFASTGLLSPHLNGIGSGSEGIRSPASPAYYPPRETRNIHLSTHNQINGGTTVRPSKILEGHGEGAVFDVTWKEGTMLSAGEDGMVGIWGVDPDL